MKFFTIAAQVVLISGLVEAIPIFKPRGDDAENLASWYKPGLPSIKNYSDPSTGASQFRLAYNGPNGMTVSWSTPNRTNTPTVYYGESPFNLNQRATGNSETFQTAVTWDNHVSISNLKSGTKYYYRIGDHSPSFNPQKENFYFVTSKPVSNHDAFSIGIFADLGYIVGNSPSTRRISPTFDSVLNSRESLDFIWHSGDFGYADNWMDMEKEQIYPNVTGPFAYNNIMNSFYDEFTPVTKNTPYMVGPGNHDASCIESDTTTTLCPNVPNKFTAWRSHFSMPTNDQTRNYYPDMWYSWNHGMVHFVQINTETDMIDGENYDNWGGLNPNFAPTNQQIQWLEADLAAVDRSKTPWVIVSGHHPIYNSIECFTDVMQSFESILIKYGVDLFWAGHEHMYERSNPVANYQVDPKGLNNPKAPWYITAGAAGNLEGNSVGSNTPNFTAVTSTSYGWVKLTFHNSTHLSEEFIDSDTGNVVDQATLYKERGRR